MNPVSSLPPETQLLKRLWINRFKVLMEADRLLGTEKFKDIAHAYLKCAEELENPPLDLLKDLIPELPCEPEIDSKEFERLVKIKEKMEDSAQYVPTPKPMCNCKGTQVCDICSVYPLKKTCNCGPLQSCVFCSPFKEKH